MNATAWNIRTNKRQNNYTSITDTSSRSIWNIWIRQRHWVIDSSFWSRHFQNYWTNKRGRQYTVLKAAHFHHRPNRHIRWEQILCNHRRTTFKVHDVRKYDYVTFVWGARQAARFRTSLTYWDKKKSVTCSKSKTGLAGNRPLICPPALLTISK